MLLGGLMKRKVIKNLDQLFGELKAYAETGEVSEEKQKRLSVPITLRPAQQPL